MKVRLGNAQEKAILVEGTGVTVAICHEPNAKEIVLRYNKYDELTSKLDYAKKYLLSNPDETVTKRDVLLALGYYEEI